MPAPHRRPSRTAGRPTPDAGPFTAADASALGWTPAASRHAVATGRWDRLRPGVFDLPLCDEPITHRHLRAVNLRNARASAATCDRTVISHVSGGIALGLPTVMGTLQRACLTVPSGTALRALAQVHLHRATLRDDDVCMAGRDRVTAPARTVLDIAREHGVDAGVVAADAALAGGLVTPADLEAVLTACAGWPGRAAARRTVELADGRSESPLESLSRLRIGAAGLPAPTPQASICDERGRFIGRCDFYWAEYGVVGEADGNLKYELGRPAIEAQNGETQSTRGSRSDRGPLGVR